MENTTTAISSLKRSPPFDSNREEQERIAKTNKSATVTVTGIARPQDSEPILSPVLTARSEELLQSLFLKINNQKTSTQDQRPPFDIIRDVTQAIKSYLEQPPSATPALIRRRSSILTHWSTPSTATSGPLKKRIKRRYSLNNTSLSPFTPSGFFSLTPTFDSDIQVPPVRLPFANISSNTISESQADKGKNKNKKSPGGLKFSLKKYKRANVEHLLSLNNCIVSRPAMTPTVASKKNERFILPSKKTAPHENMTRYPIAVSLSMSTQAAPTTLGAAATARLPILLPVQSPISSTANHNNHRSSGRLGVSLDAENPNSYMCLIRQQLEFFEM